MGLEFRSSWYSGMVFETSSNTANLNTEAPLCNPGAKSNIRSLFFSLHGAILALDALTISTSTRLLFVLSKKKKKKILPFLTSSSFFPQRRLSLIVPNGC